MQKNQFLFIMYINISIDLRDNKCTYIFQFLQEFELQIGRLWLHSCVDIYSYEAWLLFQKNIYTSVVVIIIFWSYVIKRQT